jgi:hypothetical protein
MLLNILLFLVNNSVRYFLCGLEENLFRNFCMPTGAFSGKLIKNVSVKICNCVTMYLAVKCVKI